MRRDTNQPEQAQRKHVLWGAGCRSGKVEAAREWTVRHGEREASRI